ncbi:aldehyde ferredoxin oxidoreductase family protein [Candidatus Bipolaricaulota bacterium]|nr:aldehyde ferredoxin oxidoreductase family protein [Candidatus Bipolaricaulota bacterium]
MSAEYRWLQQRCLEVDLSTRQIREREISEKELRLFLGGRGIGAYLLWNRLPKAVDPFDPDNPLIFSTGTLTGTNVPMSGRAGITFVSPATGLYFKGNVGGHFGVYLKLNGVDYIVVHGVASSPVYLLLDDEEVEIRDAGDLWGRTVRETNRALAELHGDDIEVACIGPAGENRVRFASVMVSVYNALARGGIGAVMGSKFLKAVAVKRPHGTVRPRDVVAFRRTVRELRQALLADTMADSYYKYGTAASIGFMNEIGTLPSYNFQRGSVESVEQLTSEYWNERGLLKGRIGCASCVYSCHRFIKIDEGRYAGTYSGGPEYETVSALGSGPGVTSIGALQKANALCNDLGLDTISTGGVIQWAMETYERGLLPNALTEGLDLHFGSEEAVTELPRLIAYRKGIGDLLAEGVKRAAEKVGGESWKWAVHTRGLEQSRVETRGAMGYALAFAVNPRGPDHLHTECLAEFGMTPEMRALIREITGSEEYARPDIVEKRAEIVRWHEDIYAVSDALGLCAFTSTAAYGATPERCARLFAALTGISMDKDRVMEAGRRIITLERMINLRLGWKEDPSSYAPWRLMNERVESLHTDDPILSIDKMRFMVRQYYRLHGWDEKTGVPSRSVLERLGLLELANDKVGKES